jgi:hypothetical protein
LSNVKILATSKNLKCRFCEFDDDDTERFTTLGEGEIKDPVYDVIYDESTNTIRDATIYTRYAYVECPNHNCKRFYIPIEGGPPLEEKLVRLKDEENEFVMRYPKGESLNIRTMAEYGTVMCSFCCHPDNLSEKKFAIVYSKLDAHPFLAVSCERYQCFNMWSLPPRGTHLKFLVSIKESILLKALECTVEPFESLETYDVKDIEQKVIQAITKLLKEDAETRRLNQLNMALKRCGYKRPYIILDNKK